VFFKEYKDKNAREKNGYVPGFRDAGNMAFTMTSNTKESTFAVYN
jgi:hypothetical protein